MSERPTFLESWSVRKWSFWKKLVQRAAAVRRRADPSFGMPPSKMRVVHEEKGVRAGSEHGSD